MGLRRRTNLAGGERLHVGLQSFESKVNAARELAASGAIDSLSSGKPQALRRAFVFHSADDPTVVVQSGKASIAFLAAFIGNGPEVDWGNADDDSNHAGHGIVSPGGTDSCRVHGREKTYVRQCGAEDNARDLFRALYPDVPFDASKRVDDIQESEVWRFTSEAVDRAGEVRWQHGFLG